MEVKELEKKFEKGFKLDYTKLQEAKRKCEIDKGIQECKRKFSEMGIEWFD